jgi:hypothetical protein
MARMALIDFDNELIARGFDGFKQPTRFRYINWGYMRIARRARWMWEQTSLSKDLVPGDTGIGAWDDPPDANHPIGFLKSITKVYVTTPADRRAKLRPLSDDEFFERWYLLDLTNAQQRSTPMGYYTWEEKVWLLPPPDQDTSVVVHYKQQAKELTGDGDIPLTPPDLDEAIITAALIRCHKRASEVSLTQQNQMELEEVFADMASDESFFDEEQPERVSPDDQWL